MLENRDLGASLTHLDFNTHGDAHLARSVQEGVAFAFQYGMDVLREIGMRPVVIRAGLQNMFASPVFREILTATTGVSLELYRTDGAEGAARGAAFGVGHYASLTEALSGLRQDAVFEPNLDQAPRYREAYRAWANELTERMSL
jgi:xylulokinase